MPGQDPDRGARRDVSRLAESLVNAYLAHHAAMSVATSPAGQALIPEIEAGQKVAIGRIRDDQGRTVIEYDFEILLSHAAMHDFDRVWLTGSLIELGDALAGHSYFDHTPRLEMIRHLRNAVGHGNRFNITRPERLERYPAHTRGLLLELDDPTIVFEIAPELDGAVLFFDFMRPHHVLSLMQYVAVGLLSPDTELP